jgi:hypothetical protein
MDPVRKFLILLIIVILLLPAFQKRVNFISSKPLKGVFSLTGKPAFTDSSWFRGSFQQQYRLYEEDCPGFKSDFVRLYNQIDFNFFGIVHASKIILGKERCLYPVEYLHAAAGKDFAGTATINSHVRNLKTLQDLLWNRYRIFLLVILCPDKPTFYPEYIPDRYLSGHEKITNAMYTAQRCVEEGVHVIDFNPCFLAMKYKLHYPLIPKTGVHWSYYGAYFAADSMARYLKAKTGIPVPQMKLDSISLPALPIAEDNDIGATLNLIWDIPSPQTAYPKFHGANETSQPKPSALFVGDSFYWNWYYSGIIGTLFSNKEFWYYCKDVYSGNDQQSTPISNINLEDVIKRQNFIILIQVNGAYGNPGYGFTEIAMSALDPNNSELARTILSIKSNPGLMEDIKKKAERNHLKFEEQLRRDALWIIEQKKNNYNKK